MLSGSIVAVLSCWSIGFSDTIPRLRHRRATLLHLRWSSRAWFLALASSRLPRQGSVGSGFLLSLPPRPGRSTSRRPSQPARLLLACPAWASSRPAALFFAVWPTLSRSALASGSLVRSDFPALLRCGALGPEPPLASTTSSVPVPYRGSFVVALLFAASVRSLCLLPPSPSMGSVPLVSGVALDAVVCFSPFRSASAGFVFVGAY